MAASKKGMDLPRTHAGGHILDVFLLSARVSADCQNHIRQNLGHSTERFQRHVVKFHLNVWRLGILAIVLIREPSFKIRYGAYLKM